MHPKKIQVDQLDEAVALPTKITDLDDLANDLWMRYFKPAQPLAPAEKRELRDSYNQVAEAINKASGFSRVIKLTPSTLWIASKEGAILPAKRPPGAIPTGATPQRSNPAPNFKQLAQSKAAPKVTKEPGGESIIGQIIAHHKAGLSNKQIIELGFNKSTVGRQVGEYKKRQQNS